MRRFLFLIKEKPCRRRPDSFLKGLEPCIAVPCRQGGWRNWGRLVLQRSLGLDLLDVLSVCLLNGHPQATFHPLPGWFNCFQARLDLVFSANRGVIAARDSCGIDQDPRYAQILGREGCHDVIYPVLHEPLSDGCLIGTTLCPKGLGRLVGQPKASCCLLEGQGGYSLRRSWSGAVKVTYHYDLSFRVSNENLHPVPKP
jgi:hypothetical protein